MKINSQERYKKVALIVFINYMLLEILCAGALFLYRLTRNQHTYRPLDKLALTERQTSAIKNIIEDKFGYIKFDNALGWSIRKNSISKDGKYKSNSDGIRGDKDYSLNIPNGKARITTFGDSFTHGDGVHNKDTWQSVMESKQSHLEVLNFGVGGYGLDQAYLRFIEHGSKYEADIVVIGFMTENINRNRNTFRPFYYRTTGLPFSKPRFKLINGKLSLIPSYFKESQDYSELLANKDATFQELGKDDFYYQKAKSNAYLDWSPLVRMTKFIVTRIQPRNAYTNAYTNDPETLEATKVLFKDFRDKVNSLGQKPIVVIFPNEDDIMRCNEGQEKTYIALIDYLSFNNFDFIDLGDRLCDYKPSQIFFGHYNPLGNRIVAETLLQHISK